jgi:hypothetical protein
MNMQKFIILTGFFASWISQGFAQEKTLKLEYTAYFLGLPVGEGNVNAHFSGNTYSTTMSAKTKGVGSLSSGWMNMRTSGTVEPTRLNGTSFGYESKGRQGITNFTMSLAKNVVTSLTKDPERPLGGPIMPLTEAHKRGVVDPFSATMIILGANEPPLTEAACAKKFPIFDGWLRYDMSFTFQGIEEVKSEAYSGKAVKCRVHLNFIAGYRTDKPIVKENEKVPIHIWLIPLPETRWLVPYKLELQTKYGKGSLIVQSIEF